MMTFNPARKVRLARLPLRESICHQSENVVSKITTRKAENPARFGKFGRSSREPRAGDRQTFQATPAISPQVFSHFRSRRRCLISGLPAF
jgi:hypothetical protein